MNDFVVVLHIFLKHFKHYSRPLSNGTVIKTTLFLNYFIIFNINITELSSVYKLFCRVWWNLNITQGNFIYKNFKHSLFIGIDHGCVGHEIQQQKLAHIALLSDVCLLSQQLIQSLRALWKMMALMLTLFLPENMIIVPISEILSLPHKYVCFCCLFFFLFKNKNCISSQVSAHFLAYQCQWCYLGTCGLYEFDKVSSSYFCLFWI